MATMSLPIGEKKIFNRDTTRFGTVLNSDFAKFLLLQKILGTSDVVQFHEILLKQ